MLLKLLVNSAIALAGLASATAQPLTSYQQLALDIYKELVEINTVVGQWRHGACGRGDGRASAGGGIFRTPMSRCSSPRRAREISSPDCAARASAGRSCCSPISTWSTRSARTGRSIRSGSPSSDGYFYGRGTTDNKFMAAAFVANLIRYKQEGYTPDRDIILALETDEEILDAVGHGIRWLLANHRPLIDAEFALNEGGRVGLKAGKPVWNSVQVSEKVVVTYKLEVKDKGGHSSLPTRDNAIYRLAEGLVRLSRFNFPFKLNDTTRPFFLRAADAESAQVAADMRAIAAGGVEPGALAITRLSANPFYNAQLRTTCVATQIEGGHAVNALPQTARATVNCRVLPGELIAEVEATLKRVLADDRISITPFGMPVRARRPNCMGR